MSSNLILFLFSIFLSLSHSEIEFGSCENNTRKITFENGTIYEFPCIICPIGQYTTYYENEDNFNCSTCEPGTSNFGENIIINSFSTKILSRYYYTSFSECQDDENDNICPEWKINPLSLKVDYSKDIIKSKSIFTIKQYYMNEGELIIKYINYNGGINKYFNLYINNILIYKDDSDHSIIKTKTFPMNKGENIIKFEYIIDNNLSSKSIIYDDISYFEIFEIKMINAETSSLDCNRYDSLDILKETIHDNCDYYINKCSNDIYCTYRFYSENKSEYCNYLEGIETIIYNKIDEAVCTELIKPPNIEVECEHCTYGQKLFLHEENESKCIYCDEYYYNSKLINDEETCEGICDVEDNKLINKILYITSFDDPSQIINENIIIELDLGYLEVKYEKFNEKNDTNIFIEINDLNLNRTKTIELINPEEEYLYQNYYHFNIPIEKGNYSISIKGKNLKLKKISIKGSNEGGNYKCVDKLNTNAEKTCPKKDEYYSKINDACSKCLKGSIIDFNKQCIFIEQFINNKFYFDNYNLINNIFSASYNIKEKENEYFLNINPAFPLIYLIDKNKATTIIGKELYQVKLVKGINNRGIILSFISNDNNEKYITNIFIKCKTNMEEEDNNLIYNNMIKKDDINNFFFTLLSNESCPYCLVSEIDIIEETRCVHKHKTVNLTIKNESLCVIKSFDNSTNSKLINDDSILLDYNSSDDQFLISNFKIDENIPINYEKDDDIIITSFYNLNISCKYKRTPISKMGTGIKILLIFAGVLLLFVLGIIIWKIIDVKRNNIPKRLNESLTELSENFSSKANDFDDAEKENLKTIKD